MDRRQQNGKKTIQSGSIARHGPDPSQPAVPPIRGSSNAPRPQLVKPNAPVPPPAGGPIVAPAVPLSAAALQNDSQSVPPAARMAWGRPAAAPPLVSVQSSSMAWGQAPVDTEVGSGALSRPAPFLSGVGGAGLGGGQGGDDEESSSGGEGEEGGANAEELEGNIFGKVFGVGVGGGGGGEDAEMMSLYAPSLQKIRDQLLAAHSGAARCLICLERIRGTDPVWACDQGCHCPFHLLCIQSWARQAANAALARAVSDSSQISLAEAALISRGPSGSHQGGNPSATWQCPKCRFDYPANEVPREYRCFCGKVKDPEFDPWLSPHTCGEACGKNLPGKCGHRCTLLCHPGPCPPCPQIITTRCHCGRKSEPRRCGFHLFSCVSRCGKKLGCGKHSCAATCHPGECPPCPAQGEYRCRCGGVRELRACADREYSCHAVCGRQFSCERHVCERECHVAPCGACPLAGKRSCPCGKMKMAELPCDKPPPSCGGTCDRVLGCGDHLCADRCHSGPCSATCRVVVSKGCTCGGTRKQVGVGGVGVVPII